MNLFILYLTFGVYFAHGEGTAIKLMRQNTASGFQTECYFHNMKHHGTCKLVTECPDYTITKNYTWCDRHRSLVCCSSSDTNKFPKSYSACEMYKKIVLLKPNHIEALGHTKYPHMALIGWLFRNDKQLEWNCGGNLISNQFVLASAHCIAKFKKLPHVVRFSEYDLTSSKLSEDHDILKVILHPEYRHRHVYHDIALIKLNDFVSLRTYLRPACLIQSNTNRAFPNVFETGWYLNNNQNQLKIQQNKVSRVDDQLCRLRFQLLSPRMATSLNPFLGCYRNEYDFESCRDNDDRTIHIRNTINNSYVYEIKSLFSYCGNAKFQLYTDISNYIDWIESIVWQLEV